MQRNHFLKKFKSVIIFLLISLLLSEVKTVRRGPTWFLLVRRRLVPQTAPRPARSPCQHAAVSTAGGLCVSKHAAGDPSRLFLQGRLALTAHSLFSMNLTVVHASFQNNRSHVRVMFVVCFIVKTSSVLTSRAVCGQGRPHSAGTCVTSSRAPSAGSGCRSVPGLVSKRESGEGRQ